MDSETYNELRLIVASIWLDIEDGFNAIPTRPYWLNLSKDLSELDKERLESGDFSLPVPTKHRDAWLKAMNILKCFEVFRFRLVSEDRQFVQHLSCSDLPNGDLCYLITRFSMDNFLAFCDRFDFDLTHPIVKAHKGYLKIDAENTPIAIVDGIEYHLPPLHESTLVKMLKIALLPFLRGTPLSKSDLNREGSNPDVVKQILGGKKFYLGDNVKRLRRYRIEIDFPEILDDFYKLTETRIIGNGMTYITDEHFEEIQRSAEYHEPHRKQK